MWPIAIGGVVFLFASVGGVALGPRGVEAWGQLAGSILYCGSVWVMARYHPTAIGLREGEILVRHMLPGLVERVPLDRLQRVTVSRGWLKSAWLTFDGSGLLPMVLAHTPYATGYVNGWDGLVEALRTQLEPLGKWKEGERGAWS
jgi:hypothetical protein